VHDFVGDGLFLFCGRHPGMALSTLQVVPANALLDGLSSCLTTDEQDALRASQAEFDVAMRGVAGADAAEAAAAKQAMLQKLVVDVASMRGDLGRDEVLRMMQGSLGRLLQVMLQMQVRSGASVCCIVLVAWLVVLMQWFVVSGFACSRGLYGRVRVRLI
jgi:hypothetical protein